MLSKRAYAARSILALLLASCTLPWAGERQNEINLVFNWRNNQMILEAAIDGRSGKFIVGSAQPRSVLDPDFANPPATARVVLGERFTTSINPVVGDLGGIADGILGADIWKDSILTIDYRRRLVILRTEPVEVTDHTRHSFAGAPSIPITVNGKSQLAVLDLALPDSVILPSNSRSVPGERTKVALKIGEHDLGTVDAGFAPSSTIRIGNRVLSRFLVQIDYRRGVVALWRDPRGT